MGPNLEKDTDDADAALEGQLESLGISCEDTKEGGDQSEDDTSSTQESLPTEEKENEKTEEKENEKKEEKENEEKEMKEVVPGCVRGRWQEISTEGDSSWDSTSSQENLQVSMAPCLPKGPPETEQCIVPQLLIDHYVSMVDPSRAQTVDNDIARHCAFSLPAVALTVWKEGLRLSTG